MSMTKRYLFDPAFAEQRRQAAETAVAAFPHRLPARRRNKLSARPYWDPLWESALYGAAAELKIAHITVNASLGFASEADRDRVRERAESLWSERHAHYAARSPR